MHPLIIFHTLVLPFLLFFLQSTTALPQSYLNAQQLSDARAKKINQNRANAMSKECGMRYEVRVHQLENRFPDTWDKEHQKYRQEAMDTLVKCFKNIEARVGVMPSEISEKLASEIQVSVDRAYVKCVTDAHRNPSSPDFHKSEEQCAYEASKFGVMPSQRYPL